MPYFTRQVAPNGFLMEDVRFPVEIRAALRTIVYPSGDPSGRFGLLGIGVERGEKAGQGTIPVNPPELLLGKIGRASCRERVYVLV